MGRQLALKPPTAPDHLQHDDDVKSMGRSWLDLGATASTHSGSTRGKLRGFYSSATGRNSKITK
jgi:hypothetical protein